MTKLGDTGRCKECGGPIFRRRGVANNPPDWSHGYRLSSDFNNRFMLEPETNLHHQPVLRRGSLNEHAAHARAHLEDAKDLRVEHHAAVQAALGGGAPLAMSGQVPQDRDDSESDLPVSHDRLRAWQDTIKDFRHDPDVSR